MEVLEKDSSDLYVTSYRAGSACVVVSHCPDASW